MPVWETVKRLMSVKLCKFVISILLPFFLIPLAISPSKELRCTYVIVVVASYWLLEPVSIASTALLPVVLFPLLGVLNSADVCSTYMSETFMMFIGGLIMAIAVENCNLHERIALKVLLLLGTDIIWLMLGFMMTTMFLSMWISNTATSAMMVPIVEAVVNEITSQTNVEDNGYPLGDVHNNSSTESKASIPIESSQNAKKRNSSKMKVVLLLSVCYSANIGGTGTLTGTGPNLVLKGLMEELYPHSDDITFASWMLYNVPGMLLCVFIAWIYLYVVLIRCSKDKSLMKKNEGVKEVIANRYKKLKGVSFQESVVIVLFFLLVMLWIFRKPKFIPGWEDMIGSDTKIGDSVPAIGLSFLFFLIPADPRQGVSGPPVLDWKTAQHKLPWGVIILVGGGFALAKGAQASGLSVLIGSKLGQLEVLPAGAIVAIMCFMTAIITEVVSNTTAASILLPVLNQMAKSIGVNPLFIMLPVAVTCSYAFMLPVATPPNAIAFDSGNMKALEMIKPGFVMNMICCCVQLFMINTLGAVLFDVNNFPSWAVTTNTTLLSNHTNLLNVTH